MSKSKQKRLAMQQELSAEERLARTLHGYKSTIFSDASVVRDALARAGLALYDPASHEAIPKVTREQLKVWVANAYTERSAEVDDVADYVLNKLWGGSGG